MSDINARIRKRTEVFARFSTVGGEKGSADAARDPRGFAVKFYTEEGNYDMVGNNTPVFFIRDVIKESTGKTVSVRPVVAFPNWFVEKMPKGVEVWVLNEKAFVAFLKNENVRLPPEDIALTSYHMRRHIIAAYRNRKEP